MPKKLLNKSYEGHHVWTWDDLGGSPLALRGKQASRSFSKKTSALYILKINLI